MHFAFLWTFALLFALIWADVSVSNPGTDQTYDASDGSTTVTVKWINDGNDDLPLSKVTKYSIVLCTGPNTNIQPVKTYTTLLSKSALTYDVKIEDTYGPNGYYFVQVYAQYSDGYSIHYTNRFELTGMSGSAGSFTFAASMFSISTGDKASPQTDITSEGSINSASFSVTYTLQTGLTRYAPMQTQPGSKVTHTMYSTRLATSAYTPYTSVSPSPNVHSTITPGWSYSVTSLINTVAAAGYPTYYYPASSRVSQASLSSANKRRWLD